MSGGEENDGPRGRQRRSWLPHFLGRHGVLPAPPAATPNLLVVSDMHLGEASKDRSRIEDLKATEIEDREFCRFLEHHRTHRLDEQPWLLLFNGDVFDFAAVSLTPNPRLAQDHYGFSVSRHERRLGLDNSEQKIRWKLDRILDRHPTLLTHLADFVGSGNRVVFVVGNHDAELFWPGVQQRLVERLVDTYFGDELEAGLTQEQFRCRIEFRDWIFYLPELVYAEHGHQHDPYCSVLHPLRPLRPGQEELMELSTMGIFIRYGLSRVTGIRSHAKDHFTFLDYLRWMAAMPAAKSGQLVLAYVQSLRELFGYLRRSRRGQHERLRLDHLRAMAGEAERQGLPFSSLVAIDGLQARPSNLSRSSIASSMFLDSVLTFVLTPLTLGLWLIFGPARWTRRLAGSGAILGAATLLLEAFGARRSTELAPKLREGARRIAPLVHARFILMGHSHEWEVVALPNGATYVNSGAWLLAAGPDPALDRPDGAPLSYLVLRSGAAASKPRATLMRWRPELGEGELLAGSDPEEGRPITPPAASSATESPAPAADSDRPCPAAPEP